LGVGVEVIPLIFSKALHVTDLTLKQPEVALVRSRSGKWNFSSLGGNASQQKQSAPSPSDQSSRGNPSQQKQPLPSGSDQSLQSLSVAKLSIKDGLISVTEQSSHATPHVYKNVNLTVKNFSFTSQSPFTLSAGLPGGGGNVTLDGLAGPINPND